MIRPVRLRLLIISLLLRRREECLTGRTNLNRLQTKFHPAHRSCHTSRIVTRMYRYRHCVTASKQNHNNFEGSSNSPGSKLF